ncbi:hypothetical protein V7201_14010 [Bacillus sp. JJ1122]|uniref:hypothetical protein n=1 Tax=Bacillus sp. JJ1122 TaxID=3122951 RepID=UPI002FFE34AB
MLKDIFYYYNQSLLKILGFTILVILPVQIFLYGWIYYFNQLDLNRIETVLALYVYVLMFILTMKPFLELYKHLKINEDYSLKSMLKTFISSFGFVFFGSMIIFLLSYIGTTLFIIPGLILLTIAFFLPFYNFGEENIKLLAKKAVHFYKNRFFSIHRDVILLASINLLVWALFVNGIAQFDMNLITYTILRILINLFIFPLIYFYLAERYEDVAEV